MITKFSDAVRKQKESKTDLQNAKFKLNPIVRKGTYVRKFFMEIVSKETTLVWNMENSRLSKKEALSEKNQNPILFGKSVPFSWKSLKISSRMSEKKISTKRHILPGRSVGLEIL